jgi:phenylacetate-CoA ligase
VAAWPGGDARRSWAPQALEPERPGPLLRLNLATSLERQLEWIGRLRPAYLLSFPSNLAGVAGLAKAGELSCVQGVLTLGDMLTRERRAAIIAATGCDPKDCYSARECGYMALQCPDCDALLVQSEVVFLEVLRPDGSACSPGESGRVVVTPLHNFAQPLIRYALGDHATVGSPCGNGLGYPVLERIVGRNRNLFQIPGIGLVMPDLTTDTIERLLRPRYWQVAQTGPLHIEVRMVPSEEPSDFAAMEAYVRAMIGAPVEVSYRIMDEIPRLASGKREDYVCELPNA